MKPKYANADEMLAAYYRDQAARPPAPPIETYVPPPEVVQAMPEKRSLEDAIHAWIAENADQRPSASPMLAATPQSLLDAVSSVGNRVIQSKRLGTAGGLGAVAGLGYAGYRLTHPPGESRTSEQLQAEAAARELAAQQERERRIEADSQAELLGGGLLGRLR